MIKPDIIKKHIDGIYENLAILDKSRSMSLEQFKANKTIIKATEHCLQLAIQCLLDISHYIIANKSLSRPNDSREAILTLGIHDIIPDGFAKKIAPKANFKNLPFH